MNIIETAKEYLDKRLEYGDDPEGLSDRVYRADMEIRSLIRYSEALEKKLNESCENEHRLELLLKHTERRLHDTLGKCTLYERIAKERAQRARKKASDPSGYVCTGSREFFDHYEVITEDGKTQQRQILAYKTTLQMPYPSGLGFAELRRLLEVDLVGGGEGVTPYNVNASGIGYLIGLDRIPEGLPADGKHPGILEDGSPEPLPNILYRVQLITGRKYPEADLYTTQAPEIPPEMFF